MDAFELNKIYVHWLCESVCFCAVVVGVRTKFGNVPNFVNELHYHWMNAMELVKIPNPNRKLQLIFQIQ